MKSMKAYNAMQGQSSPPAQVVSITNTGEGKLYGNMDWMMDGAETNRARKQERESFCGKRLSFLRFSSEC
jgi:hypothetical protein